jgi:hypothetical protein
MSLLHQDDAKRLVRELYERVDGGYCDSCTAQACDALRVVFPDVDWHAIARTVCEAES